jgi:acetylornithine deacetylase/succinyl-diaminopimelate desuccinylase-like protein
MKAEASTCINWEDVERKATDYLSRYLQIDTTNPPGNEIEGARYLQEILGREGIASDIIESESSRANLIARIKGNGSDAPLLLLSHIDVVPVEEEEWSYPPFSGKVVNGEIWGRGALDCKSLGIMEMIVLTLLKHYCPSLNRDVIMAATADEEKGGTLGVGWLSKNRPEFQDVGAVINEGGGVGIARKTNNFYCCQVAEKGVSWVRLMFKGSPGHASIPREDNCILALGQSLDRIGKHRSPAKITPVMEKFIEGFSKDEDLAPVFDRIRKDPHNVDEVIKDISDRGLRQLLETKIRNTFVPTMVHGGEKTNVIPSECSCELDCRMLPGESPEGIAEEIEMILKGIPGFSLHTNQSAAATESSTSHELYRIFEHALCRHDPKATLIPFISSGATDSRFFRNENVPAFGFAPLLVEGDLADYHDLLHGHNERISQDNLLFGTKVLFDAVKQFCT